MKKRLLSLVLCLTMTASLFMGGCGSKTDEVEPQPEQDEELVTEFVEEGEDPEPGAIPEGMARSYLTGEWVDENVASNRPVGIMIENSKAAQPGYGTSQADVIYEFEAEGGISRMLALYSDFSGMDRWGNVRSAREYFCYTAIAWDAIYVHFGGAIEAYQKIFDLGIMDDIDLMSADNCYSFRSSDKKAPHNAYTTSADIEKSIEGHGYSTKLDDSFDGYFRFNKYDDQEIELDGEDAKVISAYQSDCKPYFVYNEDEGVYERFEFGSKHMDAYYDKQLAFKNVLIQITSVDAYYSDIDGHDRVDVGLVGTGKGYFATNGKAIEVTWKCDSEGGVTRFYDASGEEIRLNQGKTMVCVVDEDNESKTGVYASMDDYNSAK